MDSNNGKQILVVGGSSGIGRATVERLLDSGAAVTVWSRRDASQIVSGAQTAQRDVAEELPTDLPELPDNLDGLVYAPGTISLGAFARLTPQQFLDDYNTNVVGLVRTLQAVHKQLLAGDGASVVMFSTVAARIGMQFHASIAAAKAGIEGLARSLAAEYAGKGVRFNVIAPSLTDTPLAERLLSSDKKREAAGERHPLKRVGSPQEIAGLVTWLLGPDGAWVTGQTIGVDGGLSSISGL